MLLFRLGLEQCSNLQIAISNINNEGPISLMKSHVNPVLALCHSLAPVGCDRLKLSPSHVCPRTR